MAGPLVAVSMRLRSPMIREPAFLFDVHPFAPPIDRLDLATPRAEQFAEPRLPCHLADVDREQFDRLAGHAVDVLENDLGGPRPPVALARMFDRTLGQQPMAGTLNPPTRSVRPNARFEQFPLRRSATWRDVTNLPSCRQMVNR